MTVELGTVVSTPRSTARGFHREQWRSLVHDELDSHPHWVVTTATVRRNGAGNPESLAELTVRTEEVDE